MTGRLTPELTAFLVEKGMRQVEIAEEFGVSRQYVNALLRKAGVESPVTIVSENMPWEITEEFYLNTIYQAVRLHGHAQVGGMDALNGSSINKLRAFHKKLTVFKQVIDFNPKYPALPGVSNSPGFAYVPRSPQDEDFIIKIRSGVNITPLGDRIWRLPTV